MTLLPPTVGERLARCGTLVWVFGVTPGSEVRLRRIGPGGESDFETITAEGTRALFELDRPLEANERISARQRTASDESEWGNSVEVEDVMLPPAPPRTEPSIQRCGRCTLADGAPPGSTIELRQGGSVIGRGEINRHGWTCLRVEDMPRSTSDLRARAITCDQDSPPTDTIEVDDRSYLPPPVVVEPVFGCQTKIKVKGLVPGVIVELFANGDSLGTVCSCWSRLNINVRRALVNDERITAIQRMNPAERDCALESLESDPPVRVVPPNERIKPQILEPLYEGDTIIRVANQIEGGTITLYVSPSEGEEEAEIGCRPSSEYPEIPVPESAALQYGQVVRAMQELCGRQEYSDSVTVQSRPAVIDPPRVRAPLYACSVVVVVDDVVPGATVYVLQDGIPIGHAWSPSDSVVIQPVTVLRENGRVTAYQVVGGQRSINSAQVIVDAWEGRLPRPSIPPPVRPGDTSVWVAGLVPGAYVRVFDNGVQVGGGHAVDSAASIPVWWPIGENTTIIITASQSLCLSESNESAPRPATPEASCYGPPPYEPSVWNDDNYVQESNNCYNYGCDIRNNTEAQPGRASGLSLIRWQTDCDLITNAALADGLRRCLGACHPCHHKVALAVDPGWDFHWYRQDDNGRWSHKPGAGPARNTDGSGNLITNPEIADRRTFTAEGTVAADYTEFCGYFCVNKDEVVIL